MITYLHRKIAALDFIHKLSRARIFTVVFSLCAAILLHSASTAATNVVQQSVAVDWGKPTGVLNPLLRTLNISRFYNIPPQRQEALRAAISFMKPSLIRLHDGGLINRWYDPKIQDWNYETIKGDMELVQSLNSTPLMLTIPGWPAHLNKANSKEIDNNNISTYGNLCLKLVRYMINILHAPIQYVEITNEKDFIYWQKTNIIKANGASDLAAIYKGAADPIKAEFPFLKVGGPAASSAHPVDKLIAFSKYAGRSLDFVSFHYYPTGSRDAPTAPLFEKSRTMFSAAEKIALSLQNSGHRPDIFLDEFNINYNWKKQDLRMTNEIGSAFDASIIFKAAYSPMALVSAWNAVDTVYGKMSTSGTRRPSSYLYHYLQNLKGKTIKVSTSVETLVALATRTDDRAGFAITNTSGDPQKISLQHLNLPNCEWRGAIIDATGSREITSSSNPREVELPPFGTTVYWTSSVSVR